MLTFDEPTHTYRWNGTVVPSVTQVLADLQDFSHVPAEVLERAQLRGSNVHLMCQFHDEDRLELSEFTAEEQSYLPAWQRFLYDMRPNWRHIEVPGYNALFGFAGTPDREGYFENHSGPFDWVIDIKTCDPHPLQGLQTAAYCEIREPRAVREKLMSTRRRATVHLATNGTYRFREWESPTDWAMFVSLLNIRNWIKGNLS